MEATVNILSIQQYYRETSSFKIAVTAHLRFYYICSYTKRKELHE